MGKALAIGSEVCYNPGMETNPLQMNAVDMIHEAVLESFDAESAIYRVQKWIRRCGVSQDLSAQLCGRISAAQDIIFAIRKELEATKTMIEYPPQP